MIPDYMLPHDVTVVHPATSTDGYGNTVHDYGAAAARVTIRGWIQQDNRTQVATDGADPLQARWLLVTNSTEPQRRDRIEWTGPAGQIQYTLDGAPAPLHTPAGFHHTECQLKVVQG